MDVVELPDTLSRVIDWAIKGLGGILIFVICRIIVKFISDLGKPAVITDCPHKCSGIIELKEELHHVKIRAIHDGDFIAEVKGLRVDVQKMGEKIYEVQQELTEQIHSVSLVVERLKKN